jgi:hypothetical protein
LRTKPGSELLPARAFRITNGTGCSRGAAFLIQARRQIASRSFLPDEKSGQAAVAMTDHFFGGEVGEKEAGHQF